MSSSCDQRNIAENLWTFVGFYSLIHPVLWMSHYRDWSDFEVGGVKVEIQTCSRFSSVAVNFPQFPSTFQEFLWSLRRLKGTKFLLPAKYGLGFETRLFTVMGRGEGNSSSHQAKVRFFGLSHGDIKRQPVNASATSRAAKNFQFCTWRPRDCIGYQHKTPEICYPWDVQLQCNFQPHSGSNVQSVP